MKVLLIEDEGIIAMVMADWLEELGHEVLATFGAVEPALAWLDAGTSRPDVAVLDVNLSGEQAYPVAGRLRQMGVPFVFATGYGAIDDERFADCPVLKKPLDLDEFAQVVEALGA